MEVEVGVSTLSGSGIGIVLGSRSMSGFEFMVE